MINFRFYTLLTLSIFAICNGEIITLKNEDQIVCITDDEEIPVYIEPPVIQDFEKNSLLLGFGGLWDDWVLKRLAFPILDKRWEAIETKHTSQIKLPLISVISFSVHSKQDLTFILDSDLYSNILRISPKSTSSWAHFTIFVKNQTLYMYEFVQGVWNLISEDEGFIPEIIFVKTMRKAFWKIHDHEIRWANKITTKPTHFGFTSTNGSCATLHVTLCNGCILDVNVNGENYLFNGSQTLDVTKPWLSKKLILQGDNSFILNRRQADNVLNPYWAFDIVQCPITISEKTIFVTADNSSKKRHCQLLWNEQSTVRSQTEEGYFGCEPGQLGQNCDIFCSDILGLQRKFCEGYQICEKEQCHCSWGFKGYGCQQECDVGTFGLSCANKCENCNMCNPVSGGCTANKEYSRVVDGNGQIIMFTLIELYVLLLFGLLLPCYVIFFLKKEPLIDRDDILI